MKTIVLTIMAAIYTILSGLFKLGAGIVKSVINLIIILVTSLLLIPIRLINKLVRAEDHIVPTHPVDNRPDFVIAKEKEEERRKKELEEYDEEADYESEVISRDK